MIPKNIRIIEIEYDLKLGGVNVVSRRPSEIRVIGLHGFRCFSWEVKFEEIWEEVKDVDITKLIPRGLHLKAGSAPVILRGVIIDGKSIVARDAALPISDESKLGQTYENEPFAVDWPKIKEAIVFELTPSDESKTKGSILIYAEDPSVLVAPVVPHRKLFID